MTALTRPRAAGAPSSSMASARVIPDVTSPVVGVFTAWITSSPLSTTASVFVPPTSIPTRTDVTAAPG